jgi:hypothetical protein
MICCIFCTTDKNYNSSYERRNPGGSVSTLRPLLPAGWRETRNFLDVVGASGKLPIWKVGEAKQWTEDGC